MTPRIREIVTPEGIPLRFEIAPAGDRAGAFLFDAFLVLLGTALLAIPSLLLLGAGSGGWGAALFLLGSFLLRHGYFAWFEVRRHGTTPGKKRLHLRVVDRAGGGLTAETVLARNLTREVEVFLPLAVLLSPQALLPEAPGWGMLLGSAWVGTFALMPLFNRDRLRVGDLVAGTMVVRAPRSVLLRDLTADGADAGPRLSFTPAQLSHYGIYELQVLEEILRTRVSDPAGLETVCRKIRRKIGWKRSGEDVRADEFLRAFYDAQRAHLEGRLLMGERKERKDDPGPAGGRP